MNLFQHPFPPGATPLSPEEREGLLPGYITTHAELNELEHKNIQDALFWLGNRRSFEVLSSGFLHDLHRRMFNQVWRWAGQMRKSDKNIGVDWINISSQVAQLLADTRYRIEHKIFSIDEIAARFHHRLVHIHVFPNGNGRHARLLTDLLLQELKGRSFSWGQSSSPTPIETEGPRRKDYIVALQAADQHNYAPLLVFARS